MKPSSRIYIVLLSLLFLEVPAAGDDTDIFSGTTVSVPPNVLILLDTSGSMQEDDKKVPSSIYNPGHDYRTDLVQVTGNTPVRYTVYYIRKEPNKEWEKSLFTEFAASTANIGCAEAKYALDTYGYWMGYMHPEPDADGLYQCGGDVLMKLSVGNYRNFLAAPTTESEYRITIAKRVIENLVSALDDSAVRLGLMRFDDQKDDGGKMILPVGSTDEQFRTVLNAPSNQDPLAAKGTTPVAEALSEAGLYFAGEAPWVTYLGGDYNTSAFLSGGTYISPAQWRCQKNYVILISDGLSYNDNGKKAVNETSMFLLPYLNNKIIGDYDGDGQDLTASGAAVVDTVYPGAGTHLLDDVAKFLYDEDIIVNRNDSAGVSFDHEYFPKQFITTYTVGFMTGSGTDNLSPADELLTKAALYGGGEFFSADNSAMLEGALLSAVGMILAANSSFIAPVVPVNKINRIYSGNSVYLSLFKPSSTDAFWAGNLKKFGLDPAGYLLQKDGSAATDSSGEILDNASSCWLHSNADGSATDEGGAGAAVLNQAARSFYTNRGTSASLTDSTNAFSTTNEDVKTALNVSDPVDLINFLTAGGDYARGGILEREWVLGDILHSKPATMFHGDNTIIFVGSNDGFLHALVDNDNNSPDDLSDDTLSEAWGFVPWDLLPGLHLLKDGSSHAYFVDGSPVLFSEGGYQYVTFGLRRGGSKYYTLQVGQTDSNGNYTGGYSAPVFKWEIGSDVLGVGSEPLGQSWSKPRLSTIATSSTSTNQVLLITGGYDADIEDLAVPTTTDTRGRAVFAVDAENGLLETNLNFNCTNFSDMTHCIVELTAFDYDTDGIDDTIYAGSLGGDLFAFSDRDQNGSWSKVKLFQARSAAAGTENTLLKFFTEPDAALEAFGDYVYIGTGDRAHPSDTSTVNRFYAIKNTWISPWTTLTEADLVDVTSYGYDTTAHANLVTGNGWYIKLNERQGEKVMSSPLLFNKIVFFTTHTPGTSNAADPCSISALGEGRLYALDYLTGEAALNFDSTNDTQDGTVLARSDRSTSLGVGIPSPPTLIVTEQGGAKLIIGTGDPSGDIKTEVIEIPGGSDVEIYYWKQS